MRFFNRLPKVCHCFREAVRKRRFNRNQSQLSQRPQLDTASPKHWHTWLPFAWITSWELVPQRLHGKSIRHAGGLRNRSQSVWNTPDLSVRWYVWAPK